MNTNNVYFAKIYRLKDVGTYNASPLDYGLEFKTSFSRCTLVYQKSNGRFYDLLAKKRLSCEFDSFSKIGTEIVSVEDLISFNSVVNQTKNNLSKSKIKKLCIEYKKNV